MIDGYDGTRWLRASWGSIGLLVVSSLLATPWAHAAPPAQGECPTLHGDATPDAEDATVLLVKEGMRVDHQGVLALQSLLPEEVWRYRDAFFFEGMLMEIGPCHRRYTIPAAYREATDAFAGQTSLDDDGNLENYRAGIPFPQDAIDPKDELAATRWAWNLEKRWRGEGPHGRFRITNLPTRMGPVLRFEGDFFAFQVAERADLKATDYAWSGTDKMIWAAGGEFQSPFSARGLAWRQFRPQKSERKWREPDDMFVYVPSLRKSRRAGTPWVDGAFTPNYLVAGQTQGGGGVAIGNNKAVSPGAGPSLAISEDARSGFTGMFVRPNAYVWRLLGEKTVLAPLNTVNPGWPTVEERNYGESGLSVAADRWDVRQAVVIEGALRERDETIRTVTIYVDYQTLQPLYWITRAGKRRLVEVGILVHRYSGDDPDAPAWPDELPRSEFEPVAASFFNALAGRGGWLRESDQFRSTPYTDSERKRMTSNSSLQGGH